MRFSWLAVVVVLLWPTPALAEPPDLMPPIWNPTVSAPKITLPSLGYRGRSRRRGRPLDGSFAPVACAVAIVGGAGLATGLALAARGQRSGPAGMGAAMALSMAGGGLLIFGVSSLGPFSKPRRIAPAVAVGPRICGAPSLVLSVHGRRASPAVWV